MNRKALVVPKDPGGEIIWQTPSGPITRETLLRRSRAVSDAVAARPDCRRWAVYTERADDFGAALLGLLMAEKEVVILPHARTGFLKEISSGMDGFLLSPAVPEAGAVQIAPSSLTPDEAGNVEELAVPEDVEISFFTSGSTGGSKVVKKRIRQLTSEVDAQEALWGGRLADSVIFSSVSHQHIYGFLFRFLWPLLKGRAAWYENHLFPNEMLDRMLGFDRVALVSCPTHLKRMPGLIDLAALKHSCTAVFSSGGPLSNQTALRVHEQLGFSPAEVYGSTETGGVAYRQQEAEVAASWTTIPGVQTRAHPEGGTLDVSSPFLHPSDTVDGWFAMEDNVRFHKDGTFELLGRADRIAKVEQKRVSLTEMEQRLCALSWIEDAAVTVLSDAPGEFRVIVGAAVVLSDEGRIVYGEKGKIGFIRMLKDALLDFFEPVVLPRRWAMVEAMPENAQGKRTREDVERLFTADEKKILLPDVREVEKGDTHALIKATVPEGLEYLKGHFKGHPVVPGVALIQWAMNYAQEYFSILPKMSSMKAVKFQKTLLPGDAFELALTWTAEKNEVQFTYTSGGQPYSSGRIQLLS